MIRLNRLMTITLFACAVGVLDAVGHGNELGKVEVAIGAAKVAIEYGRPSLKGRDVLKMIQVGQLWRLGADVPTTIESDTDLDFGGTRVPKGKHVLLARLVEPGKWSLVISSKPANHYEPSAKLAELPIETQEEKDPIEELTIKLSEKDGRGQIEIAWGTHRLLAAFAPAK